VHCQFPLIEKPKKDQVDRCDLEFISPYYNCDLLEASERLNCKRTCRLCPDQIATVSADYSDNPMGWGAAQYDYESTTRLFDTSTTRFEATGFTTEFTATTTEPSILTDQDWVNGHLFVAKRVSQFSIQLKDDQYRKEYSANQDGKRNSKPCSIRKRSSHHASSARNTVAKLY
jgi:hypothetical protein